ncbi:hypothetical protein BLNAU_12166 [Blattamonas nauphoetae]|uniref:Uncharacterized protein n=1 Tax=Blattamonas nauphoetae TaxID=2049346 RepID=A0ABQ9XNQ8_9EUKA|nr:hypothetical protein BLNAU_12166 [Blattamonas nauphoetae]
MISQIETIEEFEKVMTENPVVIIISIWFDRGPECSSDLSKKDEMTMDATIEELQRGVSQPEAVVNSRLWLNIPTLIRDCDLMNERKLQKMERLIERHPSNSQRVREE